jgi:hypothetical protein
MIEQNLMYQCLVVFLWSVYTTGFLVLFINRRKWCYSVADCFVFPIGYVALAMLLFAFVVTALAPFIEGVEK